VSSPTRSGSQSHRRSAVWSGLPPCDRRRTKAQPDGVHRTSTVPSARRARGEIERFDHVPAGHLLDVLRHRPWPGCVMRVKRSTSTGLLQSMIALPRSADPGQGARHFLIKNRAMSPNSAASRKLPLRAQLLTNACTLASVRPATINSWPAAAHRVPSVSAIGPAPRTPGHSSSPGRSCGSYVRRKRKLPSAEITRSGSPDWRWLA
jgi:hypothetical protein